MRQLTPLFLIAGVVGVAQAAQEPAVPAPQGASLHFVSGSSFPVDASFGIDAIDAAPRPIEGRLDVAVAPGFRTVWYACPNAPIRAGGLHISYPFEAGRHYELVCEDGKEATIRVRDLDAC